MPPPTFPRQFNLDVDELEAHTAALQPWKRGGVNAPLVLEIFFESKDGTGSGSGSGSGGSSGTRTLVERWVLHHNRAGSSALAPSLCASQVAGCGIVPETHRNHSSCSYPGNHTLLAAVSPWKVMLKVRC